MIAAASLPPPNGGGATRAEVSSLKVRWGTDLTPALNIRDRSPPVLPRPGEGPRGESPP
jgi:hypothetical protein